MSAEANDIFSSFVDLRLKVDGKELTGFTSLGCGDAIEDELVYGNQREPLGRTRGKYTVDDGTLTVYHNTFVDLLDIFGDGWGDKRFEMVEQIDLGNGRFSTTVLEGCRFKGAPAGGEEGTSALTREMKFSYLRIKRDGKYLIAQKR